MDKNITSMISKAKHDREVVAIAIFGSKARGEQFRDIDVCIFLRDRVYSSSFLSQKKLNYTLSSQKYDVHLFNQLPLYIQREVVRDALILYVKNENILYDLFFRTLRDFEHFEPIYNSYLRGVTNEN